MSTAAILLRARRLIAEPTCWHRGGWYVGGDGSYCAVGAINAASPEDERTTNWCHFSPAVDALRAASVDAQTYGIPTWNDKIATHADLMAAFKRAFKAQPLRDRIRARVLGR